MKRPSRHWSIATTVLLAALMVLVLIEGASFRPTVRLFPDIIAWTTLGLLIVALALDLLGWAETETDDEEAAPPAAPGTLARHALWMVSAFIVVLLLGFHAGIVLTMGSYLMLIARRRFAFTAAYSIGGWIVLYAFFEVVLGVRLWVGAAPQIVPGWIGGGILPVL